MVAGYAGEDRLCTHQRGKYLPLPSAPRPTPAQSWSEFPPNSRDRLMWHLPKLTTQPAFVTLALGLSSFHRAVSASRSYSSSSDATSSGKPSLVEPPPSANGPVLPLQSQRPLLEGRSHAAVFAREYGRLSGVCAAAGVPHPHLAWGEAEAQRGGMHDSPRVPQLWGTALAGTGTAAVFSTPHQPLEHSRTSWQ